MTRYKKQPVHYVDNKLLYATMVTFKEAVKGVVGALVNHEVLVLSLSLMLIKLAMTRKLYRWKPNSTLSLTPWKQILPL